MTDYEHYQYGSYTTARKQDYGHPEMNEDNGWDCYDWDREEFTETMQMKKPKEGKGWKPFRVYTYVSCYEDFNTELEAKQFFDDREGYVNFVEVNMKTGEVVREIAKKNLK